MFAGVGIAATAGLALVGRGDWGLALALFMLGNIGIYGSITFYDALLPHIAKPEELDRVSSAGYALGYLGGGVLLAINLTWIQRPAWFGFPDAGAATRAAFVSVAVWWALFSIPLLRRVPEPAVDPAAAAGASFRTAFVRLTHTLREVRRYRHAFTMLVAFMLYNDGIGTIIRMATLYGTQIGIDQGGLIGALLLTQFIGVPAAFLFGAVASKVGAKPAILGSLVLYTVICVLGFRMKTAGDFMVLAALVGLVQGGSQALSRSVFASLDPQGPDGRVLRVLRGVREVRRHLRAAAVLGGGGPDPLEPHGDPVDHRVLRRRRRAAGHRRHRRRTARGRALTRGRQGRRQGLATHPFGVLRIGHSTCCAGVGGEIAAAELVPDTARRPSARPSDRPRARECPRSRR